MASFCSTFARPLSSFLEGGRNRAKRPAVRPGSNRVPVIMRASFFRLVLRNKTGFPELGAFFYWRDTRACAPEITHRSPTKRDAKPLKKYAAATRLRACSQLRVTRLGPAAHAEALATLRRYDQGLLSEKQVARAMDRLFHPSDHELRDAFRYFLPAELAA